MANLIYRETDAIPVRGSSSVANAPLSNAEVDGNFRLINQELASKAISGDTIVLGSASTATTQPNSDDSTKIATTEFVHNVVDSEIATVKLGSTFTDLTVTNTIVGSVTGNSGTATKLTTPRSISTSGDATWTVNFDGSADVSAAITLATQAGLTANTYGSSTTIPQITVDTKGRITAISTVSPAAPAASSLTGTSLPSTIVTSSLTSVGTLTDLTVTNTINGNAATATAATNLTGGLLSNFKINTVSIAVNTTAVTGTFYVATADLTLTLPITPVVGSIVGFSNLSNDAVCIIARNGQPIMSIAEDMTVDRNFAAFILQYSGATTGWVFV